MDSPLRSASCGRDIDSDSQLGSGKVEHSLAAALKALEMNSQGATTRRGSLRFSIDNPIEIWPANMRERTDGSLTAQCQDISQAGCRIVSPVPVGVGDVYLLVFPEDGDNSIDPAYARCIRCHLLGETKFEVGMSFLSPVSLPQSNQPDSDSLID